MSESRRVGVVVYRGSRLTQLNAWRKKTPLNPYWLDRVMLRRSVERIAKSASGRMLDIGVSEAPYRELFAPHIERYIGLEYPPSALDKHPGMWSILDVVKIAVQVFGDGRRLPFRDASLDSVLATEVLEHVPHPELFVREMARVTRPGGAVLITVPFIQPLHELPSDYFRFTPSSLRVFAEEAGLEVESITPRGNFASALGALLSQWLLRSIGAARLQSDGSVILSRWRSVIVLPFTALVQIVFFGLSKLSNDTAVCQGYAMVARKPRA